MSEIGDKVPLATFLANVDSTIQKDLTEVLNGLHSRLSYLMSALTREPEILAQVEKLAATVPADLATATFSDRQAAARVSTGLIEDLKERWIAAEAPPLVDEIDKHFKALTQDLARLQQADRQQLQTIAAEIDQLAAPGAALEGIERRYVPWLIGAAVLFIVGIILFLRPAFLDGAHVLTNFWVILICLGALPALGMHFAFAIRPRTRADRQVDALNKAHFLPHGGLYFPAGERPAGVILVDWQPPAPPRPSHLKDPRKAREHHW